LPPIGPAAAQIDRDLGAAFFSLVILSRVLARRAKIRRASIEVQ
jgi:hypothetical protein